MQSQKFTRLVQIYSKNINNYVMLETLSLSLSLSLSIYIYKHSCKRYEKKISLSKTFY